MTLPSPDLVPSPELRLGRVRTWAETIVDDRDEDTMLAQGLPAHLPPPGVEGIHPGVIEVPYLDPSTDQVDVLNVAAHVWQTRTEGNALITLITYPDGHRIAFVHDPTGTRHASPAHTWTAYVDGHYNGFGPSFAANHVIFRRAAWVSALAVREVFTNASRLTQWLEALTPRSGLTLRLRVVAQTASLGFPTPQREATDILGSTPAEFIPAVDAGLDPCNVEDMDWYPTALVCKWPQVHGGWHGLQRMRREGWTYEAMCALHPYEETRALGERAEENPRFDAETQWRHQNQIDEWLTICGNPRVVADAVDAGLSLDEAAQMANDGALDPEALAMLAALRTHSAAGEDPADPFAVNPHQRLSQAKHPVRAPLKGQPVRTRRPQRRTAPAQGNVGQPGQGPGSQPNSGGPGGNGSATP